jgi:hypothetical protein
MKGLYSFVTVLFTAFAHDHAAACYVLSFEPPREEFIQVTRGGYAFTAEVLEVIWNGNHPPRGLPHAGFQTKLLVLESFAEPIGGTHLVHYGSCFYATPPGQRTNVIARKTERGLEALGAGDFKSVRR